MSEIINILHLSDLHYRKKDSHNIAVILKALISSLAELSNGPLKPNLIIFGGDLVHSADEDSDFLYFYDEVFEPISKATGCAASRFVFAPGNHDVQRLGVQKNQDKLVGLEQRLTSRDALNSAYFEDVFADIIDADFSAYTEFLRFVDPDSSSVSNGYYQFYQATDIAVDVLAVNTALTSWGGFARHDDNRKLLYPEAALSTALRSLVADRKLILVTHHPLNWLSEFVERDFRSVVSPHVSLHFFGHTHDQSPSFGASLHGNCLQVQSGALYSGRDRYIGYSVTRYDVATGHAVVHMMSYSEARREFHLAEQLSPGGVFYPTPAARTFWREQSRVIDRVALARWVISDLLERAEIEFNEGIGDRRLCDVFVPPPLIMLEELSSSESDSVGIPEKKERSVSFDDFVSSAANAIVHSPSEYGKTALIRQAALEIMRSHRGRSHPTLPVVISFADVSRGRDRIEALLRSALVLDLPGMSLSQLLQEGLVTIFIDDVEFEDKSKYSVIRDFVSKYPANRYIFTAKLPEGTRFRAVVDPELPISMESIFIKRMTRVAMRTLVSKWDAEGRLDREAVLNRLIQEIIRINVPLTAVNGTILLSIYESQSNFRPINRAVLVETFVETLLDKGSLRSAERKTFDFTNQKHLLSFIAAWMAKSESYSIERRALRELVQQYLDDFGLPNDVDRIIASLLSARIFEVKQDGSIWFRYRAFQEYFIATQMQLDAAFKDWVLNSSRYLSFTNEIQFYSGISRGDHALLSLIGERFAAIKADVIRDMNWDPDLDKLESFQVPSDDAYGRDHLLEYERQVGAPSLTQDEKDEILESEIPIDDRSQQEVYRPIAKDVGQALVLGLVLYSGVIRNLELVPDGDKRRHLAEALSAWGMLLMASLQIVPALAKNRRLKINGVTYEVNVPRHFSEAEVARTIYIGMPPSLASLVYASLGTEKLERQLANPELIEAKEPSIVAFLRASLTADLKLGGWWNALAAFAEKYRSSRYMLYILLWKMRDLHFMGEVPPGGLLDFRHTLAGAIADLRGVGKKERQNIQTREYERLTKEDMVRRLTASRTDA